MDILRNFTVGFLIGLANLIPGVSGGTFALILGVYERLISFLNRIGPRSIITFLKLTGACLASGFARSGRQTLRVFLVENDYPFMAVLGLGAITCIVAMSSLMKYLLINHFIYTYAYFFGLIVLSVVIPWRMLKLPRLVLLLPLLAGIILTVSITAGVNPYEKAMKKSEMLKQQYVLAAGSEDSQRPGSAYEDTAFAYVGKYTAGEYLYIFLCGIIAISAMVLPGVSGSLVLILMNQYFAVISAIANIQSLLLDDLAFLTAMALGISVGLVSFARLIEFAFTRFHDTTISFLVGLILGSLYSLWPFKQPEVITDYYVKEGKSIEHIENYTVYSNINIMPDDLGTAAVTMAIIAAGMFTMLFFLRPRQVGRKN